MAELLSREKELFKINQELNLLSLGSAPDSMYPAKVSTGVAFPRYATFQKQKGPTPLLRKKGIGAMNGGVTGNGSGNGNGGAGTGHGKSWKSPKSQSYKEAAAFVAASARAAATSPLPERNLLTKSKAPDWKQTKSAGAASPPTPRCLGKNGTFTRELGQSGKTATYVKYRNPNFSESPSLDMLLRQNVDEAPKTDAAPVEVDPPKRESTTVVNGQVKKQLTQDNYIKFLKAKVAILEEDHVQHSSELARQKEQLEKALEAQRKADGQRDQSISSNKHLSEQLVRAERACEDLTRRQKERQQEYTTQQRELEQLKRDAKVAKQTNINLENRLSRAQEELDAAREALNKFRDEQREQIEGQRKELKQKDSRIRTLKRQRAELLNAYKKQLYMIDNLKRQSNCLEQSAAIGFGEKEFTKVLDWNAKT
ncbi:hypothetical protein KR018_009564 [Drosophila ironensis]|nr:hypothetical protein KR018_009564 [Drosophila ironensis]